MNYKKCFLIAPSGNINQENIDLAKKKLKNLGFEKIIYKKDILSEYLVYAGDPLRRIKELNEAYLSDAEIIFSIIGGQGAIHLVKDIDYDLIKKSEKIIIGFSDITLLLNAIHQKTGARCLHGPNIGKNQILDKTTIEFLIKAINKENYEINFTDKDILKKGKSKAKIIGGNIELLGRSLGTPFEINTENKIIFLEDYDMKPWRIFDILWQLKISGKFNNVKGVLLGNFLKCGEDIDDYLKEFFKDFEVPVIMNQKIGHDEPNITIPFGETCVIDTEKLNWKILFNDKKGF